MENREMEERKNYWEGGKNGVEGYKDVNVGFVGVWKN